MRIKLSLSLNAIILLLFASIAIAQHMIDVEVAQDKAWMCLYHSPDGKANEVEAIRTCQQIPPTLRELNPDTPIEPSGVIEGTLDAETYHTRTR